MRDLRARAPRVLLLDADGNLFPSEEPAFAASSGVTNRFLASLGVQVQYTPEHLLATTTGKSFRTTAVDLASEHGVALETVPQPVGPNRDRTLTAAALERWVAEERQVVSEHLGRVLRPDARVLEPLRQLVARFPVAAVSSSALSRLDTCFRAAGLAELIPPERRFSAEDSLPTPTSKPHPAIYLHAAERLGVPPQEALAVEDSPVGAQAAVAAGIPTVGNVMFAEPGSHAARRAALAAAGVVTTVDSWEQLARMLLEPSR
jgi:beta-phosphoglucomutase-like phosphatase (HAD superfamily)